GLAIAAWVAVFVIRLLAGDVSTAAAPWLEVPFVTAALLGTGYLGTHVTRTIRDVITNEVRSERFAALYRRAEAAADAREEALAIVAHDLRNPLHTIYITTELLMSPEAAGLPEFKRSDFLRRIYRAAGNMTGIIGDLLDVARMEAGKLPVDPAPVSCIELIAEVAEQMEPLAADRQIALRMMCPEDAPVLLADRGRIMQVFSNLIGNAIKFTPPGGEIVVRAE